jgi:hypothetical protein
MEPNGEVEEENVRRVKPVGGKSGTVDEEEAWDGRGI